GETQCNKQSILQGQQDIPLSEEGLKQAALLGRRLQSQKYTHCFVSDLTRALQTAKQIVSKSKTCQSVPLTKDPRLRERKYGDIEGKPIQELRKAAKRQKVSIRDYNPPGAETIHQVRQRAVVFFQELCQLVVGRKLENLSTPSNGNTNRTLQPPGTADGCSNFLYHVDPNGRADMHAASQGNAAATVLVPSGGKPLQVHVRSNHNTQGNDSESDLEDSTQNFNRERDNTESVDASQVTSKTTQVDVDTSQITANVALTDSVKIKDGQDNEDVGLEGSLKLNKQESVKGGSAIPMKTTCSFLERSAGKQIPCDNTKPGISTPTSVYVPSNTFGNELVDSDYRRHGMYRRERTLSASSEGRSDGAIKRAKVTSDDEDKDDNRTKFVIEDSDDENVVLDNEVYKDITPNVVITPNSNQPVVMKRCDSDPVLDLGDDVLLTADILVVSHGGFLRELIRHFIYDLECNIPGGNGFALSVIPNTAVSKFTVSFAQNEERPRLTCLFIHDKEHLHCANYKNTRPVS
ncbi:uncharacterized protein LOC102800499, partial [Saccoglossus kowalevskii]|uniref:Uncharacterized protein LOC102800499 n=1 Tax=Saccoglossus kowalevskii TaxID=10224 RepID=A0ABM0MWQ4_SACKO